MIYESILDTIGRTPDALKLVYGLSGLLIVGYVLFGGHLGTAAEAAAAALF